MYAAPTQMPVIYQQYLMALGVQEFSLELIGTNNEIAQPHIITYDFNIPTDKTWDYNTTATQSFSNSVSGMIGEDAIYTIADGSTFKITDISTEHLLNDEYRFDKWNTNPDGSGFSYIDGEYYLIRRSQTLYAQWIGVRG